MTLQDLGSIGELVGGVAVVVSFFYLALQIRQNTHGLDQNTKTTTLAFENDIRRDLIAFRQSIAADEQLSAIWTRGLADEQLDPKDSARFGLLMTNFVAMLTAQFHAHRRGFYDLDRSPFFAIVARSPGFRRWWDGRAEVVARMQQSVDRRELHKYIDSLVDPRPDVSPAV